MKLKGFVSAVSALMLVSPFASAGQPVQMWKCNINGDVNRRIRDRSSERMEKGSERVARW